MVVNPSNPVSELTIAQLSAIYTNKITNWKELGGNDAPIVVMSRDTNSGTHVFFKEHVVQMAGLPTADKKLEYGSNVLLLPSTEEGVSQVASNPNAIFYAGLGYVNNTVKTIAVKKTASDHGSETQRGDSSGWHLPYFPPAGVLHQRSADRRYQGLH